MLAYELLEADIGPHGHRRSETTSPLANAAGSGFGFVADAEPVWDQATIAEHNAREAYKKQNQDVDLTGAHFPVRRVGD